MSRPTTGWARLPIWQRSPSSPSRRATRCLPHVFAQIAHVHGQLAVAIDTATLQPSVLEKAQQTIVLATSTHRLNLPVVVADGANDHDLAQPANAVPAFMALDEHVLHPDCLAKYAAASFRRSRSSVTRLRSAFSRRSSSVCDTYACRSPAVDSMAAAFGTSQAATPGASPLAAVVGDRQLGHASSKASVIDRLQTREHLVPQLAKIKVTRTPHYCRLARRTHSCAKQQRIVASHADFNLDCLPQMAGSCRAEASTAVTS